MATNSSYKTNSGKAPMPSGNKSEKHVPKPTGRTTSPGGVPTNAGHAAKKNSPNLG